MLFNSIEFFCFLAPVYALYRVLSLRWQNLALLAASYVFYGWWDVRFLFLILLSTVIDFTLGLVMGEGAIERRHARTAGLALMAGAVLFVGVPWSAVADGIPVADAIRDHPAGLYAVVVAIVLVVVGGPGLRRLCRAPAERRRKLAVALSVTANLAILGFFKYFNFFVASLEQALDGVGISAGLLRLDIVLPVGISFYTFQTMSYTIDLYRGRVEPCDDIVDFGLYVAFFPQLVAGPIERAARLLPTLRSKRTITFEQSARGVSLILMGLAKKMALADGVAGVVTEVFSHESPSTVDVAFGVGCFALQIYGDFSGYSDIARGVAKLFGIELMTNFRQPYFSTNPQEFWRRWHISLSTWLRDYLYFPLGGSRAGESKTYRNLMLTMLLGGLWHGAAWNFVLWGAFHGAILSLHRWWRTKRPASAEVSPARWSISVALFFAVTCYGWLLFRAASLTQVIDMTHALFVPTNLSLSVDLPRLAALVALPCVLWMDIGHYRGQDPLFYRRWPRPMRGALFAALVLAILLGLDNAPEQFIYFQF